MHGSDLIAIIRLGVLNSAIEAYSVAICLDPSFLEAIVGRGNAFMDFLKEDTNNLSKSGTHYKFTFLHLFICSFVHSFIR